MPHICPDLRGHRPGQPQSAAAFAFAEPCRDCRGRGLVVDDPCPTCHGTGRAMSHPHASRSRIPAGVKDGQRIRLQGQGRARASTAARPATSSSPCTSRRTGCSAARATTSP